MMKIFRIFIIVAVIITASYFFLIILENNNFFSQTREDHFLYFIKEETEQHKITSLGIIKETNKERKIYKLNPLIEDWQLNSVAEMKVNDMFENQYFAHISPSGEEASDLALIIGYDFIAVGENLAFGNFKNDEDLVNGWMESPGHRENILKSGYTEIGVAVKRGIFEEKEIWMAVQIFALPQEACPKPDQSILSEIAEQEEKISIIIAEMEILKKEIDSSFFKDDRIVEEYNTIVKEYNLLLDEMKLLVDEYNSQIELKNECVTSYGF